MGIQLNYGVDHNDQLLKVAAEYARDIHAVCADVATVIFPSAISPPSDATVSAVSAKLMQIVSDIEAAISKDSATSPPLTWQIMAKSGFLREPDLIDFILARVAEDRLEATFDSDNAKLPSRLLDHSDGNIADAAQMLLAARSLHRHAVGNSYLTLSPELLHKTCWRVVAALEVVHGARRSDVVGAARAMIADYAESDRAQAAARKILHFSTEPERRVLLNPAIAGVHLHVAALSTYLDLDQDHIVRLIDSGSSAPYAIMLAAAGVSRPEAINAIYLFRSVSLTTREAGLFDTSYESLEPHKALAETAKWSAARTNYLAFGQP